MIKSFLKLLSLAILFLVFPAVSFADTSKISILPVDPLTILPNTLSEQMTVQSQDENGVKINTTEKIILTFESSSPTIGEFVSASGNAVLKTINFGDANRNFYYRDSTEGTFIITVNAEGETTHKKWSATKQITISSGASQNTDSNPPEVLGASSDSSSSFSNSQSTGGGTTDRVSSLNAQLEIIAGNDRTTSPGSPIWFQATVKKNTTLASIDLNWSFGDGNVGVGPLVSHSYKYPGDYVVVLSSRAGDIFSVSRLKVKVTESDILVLNKGEYLEISNNGNTEVNLFNWKIENEGKGFIFQPNTIILPHSSIKLDKSLLTMKGYDNSLGTSLKNFLGDEIFIVAPIKEVDLNEASKNLEAIKKEVFAIQEKAKNLGFVSRNNNLNNKLANVFTAVSLNLPQATTSTENIIYEVPKSEGFIFKLTNFIKRVFSN